MKHLKLKRLVTLLLTATLLSVALLHFKRAKHLKAQQNDGSCVLNPKDLVGLLNTNYSFESFEEVERLVLSKLNVTFGGKWSPVACPPLHHIAILVPYRNRQKHLLSFLYHMHTVLARQQLSYGIYLIEPTGNYTFNRGIMLNAGFIEANKDANDSWQCHAFHDVDLLPEDDHTMYTCPDLPTHLPQRMSKFSYKTIYPLYFGGASIMKKEHYVKSNGFSNVFFGWGGEDDDHYSRVSRFFKIILNPDPYNKYKMLQHNAEHGNMANPERHKLLGNGEKYYDIEGLNSVKYELKAIVKTPLYTKFLVYYNQSEIMNEYSKIKA